jgi:hypothetical protein
VIPLASNLAERGKAGKPITELKVRESTQHILAELPPQEVAAVQQKQPSKRNITTAPWIDHQETVAGTHPVLFQCQTSR